MAWTQQDLDSLLIRNPSVKLGNDQAGVERTRSCTVIQEQQDDCDKSEDRQAIHHVQPKKEGMDGRGYPQFRVSITYLVSDYRRRDAWGMAETIADCIVAAVGRLLGTDATRKSGSSDGSKGRRRVRNNTGEN